MNITIVCLIILIICCTRRIIQTKLIIFSLVNQYRFSILFNIQLKKKINFTLICFNLTESANDFK